MQVAATSSPKDQDDNDNGNDNGNDNDNDNDDLFVIMGVFHYLMYCCVGHTIFALEGHKGRSQAGP